MIETLAGLVIIVPIALLAIDVAVMAARSQSISHLAAEAARAAGNQWNAAQAFNEYLIYPIYSTADLTDPTIDIAPAREQKATWLQLPRTLDGQQHKILDQGPLQDYPNYCWDMIAEGNCQDLDHYTKLTGEVHWQPGTGFDNCLGELTISHITECHFDAECSPTPK